MLEISIIIKIEKEPVMKADKEEKTCVLDVAGKGSFKTSVQVPVKGIKSMSPVQEPVIKDVKGKRSCLLDGGKGIVHVKERDESWEMKNVEGSQRHTISS